MFVFLLATLSTANFLETVAFTEADAWQKTVKELSQETPLKEQLNQLAKEILSQNDGHMAELLRGALRNYDALSDEKTEPFTFYYRHYTPPAFTVPRIDLTLHVQEAKTVVTTELQIVRQSGEEILMLDGKGHTVKSVAINGQELAKESYRITKNALVLLNVTQEKNFTVRIVSEIDPIHNTHMEGLYPSNGTLITQCEPEGARRIFYTLDRPDVLSSIRTTIVADKNRYPVRLSNGNLIEESAEKIVWDDPIPKPSYLFAAILGEFGKLEDTFTTRSGRVVALSVYMEKGKEERARFSLEALKWAMAFDERFFDREYDLDALKMVAAPDFNAGAMENKGLLVFNERALLVDPKSSTDGRFRQVAAVIAHEYFHNWSGNRVTVRNWFELALKEAFTEFRNSLFEEFHFGSALIRPSHVASLKERQFPEEISERGHPIMVDSYVSAGSIYDATTYTKGKEVFRALQTILDMSLEDGFRKAQNLYFERHDGTAVTFRELLQAARDVLPEEKQAEFARFERWFTQQGTPKVTAEVRYEADKMFVTLTQSQIHPKTKEAQEPLLIPLSIELLSQEGRVVRATEFFLFSDAVQTLEFATTEPLIPLFLHDFLAPVDFEFAYSKEELATVMKHANDPFLRFEAGQKFALLALQEALQGGVAESTLRHYREALDSNLPPIAKAQLLELPSLRTMTQVLKSYNFAALQKAKELLEARLAALPQLPKLLKEHAEPAPYQLTTEQMHVRRLRAASWQLLAPHSSTYAEMAYGRYLNAPHYNASITLFAALLNTPFAQKATARFYEQWKDDRLVLNDWLALQASSPKATVATIQALMATPGYEAQNPNHIRAALGAFTNNLGAYHDAKGEGYAFVVDQILNLQKLNPHLSDHLVGAAFIDFENLPESQAALMAKEMKRLLVSQTPDATRALIEKMLRVQ